jgi:hypothetical protein
MSKECTTHHFACDCREEKFKELERENAALRAALEDIAESTPAYHNAADFQRAYVWCKEQARAAFEGGAK